ncbi:MAG: hypothetical protein GY731_08675, partial [Gammaproteobacteria bacterium]|nr:hypothetical protein [Gammaproteobacteria bacterium]
MNDTVERFNAGMSLKEGQVIYQSDDSLSERDRQKKNLTLEELNHVFRLYLGCRNLNMGDISILGQFSLIFSDGRFSKWHTMSKAEQGEALTELVILPSVYEELIDKIGDMVGDA